MSTKPVGPDPRTTRAGATRQDTAATGAENPVTPRIIQSNELFGDQVMVLIQHLGEIYRLQTTRQGKLILTK
jgi:hemin uptake protein HemP